MKIMFEHHLSVSYECLFETFVRNQTFISGIGTDTLIRGVRVNLKYSVAGRGYLTHRGRPLTIRRNARNRRVLAGQPLANAVDNAPTIGGTA